jgi:NAD(P)-dependent dehydrogenase (short-subunit alcohol dehydrogenase family)
MDIQGQSALVTGGGSGLGEAVARELAAQGAKVAVLDVNAERAQKVASDIGGVALVADVSDGAAMQQAIERAEQAHGVARVVMHMAGVGGARRVVSRDGSPAALDDFERTVRINLIGSYNVVRLCAARIATLPALADGERGVVLMTASVAAFDGQIGQAAYSASKGGVAAMTLPLARDLASHGIRVVTVAPGLFDTPMMAALPQEVQDSLGASVPFPKRLGQPREIAQLAAHVVRNTYLNGETIRLDGALRMAPR